jgi:hypothetical protein
LLYKYQLLIAQLSLQFQAVISLNSGWFITHCNTSCQFAQDSNIEEISSWNITPIQGAYQFNSLATACAW